MSFIFVTKLSFYKGWILINGFETHFEQFKLNDMIPKESGSVLTDINQKTYKSASKHFPIPRTVLHSTSLLVRNPTSPLSSPHVKPARESSFQLDRSYETPSVFSPQSVGRGGSSSQPGDKGDLSFQTLGSSSQPGGKGGSSFQPLGRSDSPSQPRWKDGNYSQTSGSGVISSLKRKPKTVETDEGRSSRMCVKYPECNKGFSSEARLKRHLRYLRAEVLASL